MSDRHTELLISLIVGGEASPAQWEQFAALAADDPALWPQLAVAQRDHADLSSEVNRLVAAADRVSVPVRDAASGHGGETLPRPGTARPQRPRVAGRLLSWSGWAMAAALALLALPRSIWTQGQLPTAAPPVPDQAATAAVPATSAEDAWKQYIARGRRDGRVFGEMPTKILLDSRPAPGGEGWELLYLRPVLETMRVPEMYRFDGLDESGEPTLVRWEGPARRDM